MHCLQLACYVFLFTCRIYSALVCFSVGLFEPSHMNFDLDRDDPAFNTWAEPTVEEMVEKAIRILRKHENGYFLLVEGNKDSLCFVTYYEKSLAR